MAPVVMGDQTVSIARPADRIDGLRCPRCGYHLRGTIAAWRDDVCPLGGRCVECGLDFLWVDIVRGDELRPRWCVEFASWRSFPRALVGTWWRALLPHRFYRKLRMTHGIRIGRLVAYLACLVFALYACLCVTAGGLTYRIIQSWNFTPPLTAPNVWPLVRRAMLLPFSGSGRLPGTSPRELLSDVATPLAWFGSAALFAALLPIAMLVLPVSMRRARVRPRHLLRIGVYNASWLPLLVGAGIVLLANEVYFFQPFVGRPATACVIAAGVAMPVAWIIALRSYLRMPAVGAVAASTIVMAALASLVVLAFARFDALVRLLLRTMG